MSTMSWTWQPRSFWMAQRTGHHQKFLFFFCFFVNSFIVVGVRVKAGRCCLFCWVEGYECGWNPQSSATIQVKATKLFSALRVFEGYATSSCYTFFWPNMKSVVATKVKGTKCSNLMFFSLALQRGFWPVLGNVGEFVKIEFTVNESQGCDHLNQINYKEV